MAKLKGRATKGWKRIRKGYKLSIDISAVQALIEEQISPLFAVDGAQIELLSISDSENTVSVRFGGSYRGSPCRNIVLNYVVIPILQAGLDQAVDVKLMD